MQLNIYNTIEEVIAQLARHFILLATECHAKEKRFSVALSGGNSPKKLYALLASETYKNQVEWSNVDFFFGDERYVPATDAASNFRMANETLFIPLDISERQIFRMRTELAPAAAAADYDASINQYFKGNVPRFDLVLLGLGDNAHTASLFPHTDVLQEKEATVKAVFLEDQQVYRITFTAPLINLASHVIFLVYGADKAGAVHHILKGEADIENYPAQLIKANDITWFLDKAAAGEL